MYYHSENTAVTVAVLLHVLLLTVARETALHRVTVLWL
jgi:hypothetical protein